MCRRLPNGLGMRKEREACDDRILGHGDFVADIIKKAGEVFCTKETAEEALKEAAELRVSARRRY